VRREEACLCFIPHPVSRIPFLAALLVFWIVLPSHFLYTMAMRTSAAVKLSKWPFLLGALLLFSMAFLVYLQSKTPMLPWELAASVASAIVGAGCVILPFLLEFRVAERLAITDHLMTIAGEIQKLDGVAAQITNATSRWQTVQESADKTAAAAREIVDRMSGEMKEFTEFMRVATEGEKSTLKLEVEKLRRAEADWVQVLVRVLDHVFAVHQAAVRTKQPALIEQLGQFQSACRDAARRVGLVPYVPEANEPFDKERHQLVEGAAVPEPNATVQEVIATGYAYQGKFLRPALVRLAATDGQAA
jgi:molecular chaperone GrpE (heat shock protein)